MSMKTAAERLLIKPGKSLLVVNPPANLNEILDPLPERVALTIYTNPREGPGIFDVVLAFIGNRAVLESQLLDLSRLVQPKGIFWLAYTKGTSKIKTDINRDIIWTYIKPFGLEGVAMVSLNEDWSGLRVKIV
jgi:hypothetical protein